jgi:hypothetical protein
MAIRKYIGVVGGCGSVGTFIVDHLLNMRGCPDILIGGRRRFEETGLANRFRDRRLEYQQLDVGNGEELLRFCSRCFLIINVVGPSAVVGDSVALCALDCGCHYVDVGGYGALYSRLQPHAERINAGHLCFLIGAGWMPGISGIFAKATILDNMERAENSVFKVYFGAVDDWSYSSTYDLVASSMGDMNSYGYSYGKRVAAASVKDMCCRRFACIGRKKICVPSFDDQLALLADSQPRIKGLSTYVMVNDFTSMCKFIALRAFYKGSMDRATRMMQRDYKRLVDNEGKWGCVVCQTSQEGAADTYRYLYTHDNMLYTAVTAVVTVQYLLKGRVKWGLNYLCDAVDCHLFMDDLGRYGIKAVAS